MGELDVRQERRWTRAERTNTLQPLRAHARARECQKVRAWRPVRVLAILGHRSSFVHARAAELTRAHRDERSGKKCSP